MFVSGILSLLLKLTPLGHYLFAMDSGLLPNWSEYPMVVLVTTMAWLTVTYMSSAETDEVLLEFCKKVRPGGPGWKKMVQRGTKVGINFEAEEKWSVPDEILAMLLGTVFIYSALFSVGYWIYGNWTWAIVLTIVVLASGISLSMIWNKIKRVVK